MNNIFGYTKEMLEEYFFNINQKKFKAIQIYDWLYKKNIYDFKLFSNIKKEVLAKMQEDFNADFIKIEQVLEGKLDEFIDALLLAEQAEKMEQIGE